jgi:NAD(P)-dependent dehydrogenase (short-subunit alcohol dehydrogenase family)
VSARGRVVVTGASTGIGEASARKLAEIGFEVFAGVRKQADAERLGAIAGVTPLTIDITDAGSIAAAAATAGDGPLAGLVNNAGAAITAPLEFIPIDQLRRQIEVNFIGQVAVTQAFLPALRRGSGRILNISSIGGKLAMPMAGPYAASKFAIEGMSDSLRREVAQHGVDVIVIEPGGVKTPIWDKGLAEANEMRAAFGPEAERLYGKLFDKIEAEALKIAHETGLEPAAAADVIAEALTAKRPRARYLIGRDAKIRARMAAVLPDRIFDRLLAFALR